MNKTNEDGSIMVERTVILSLKMKLLKMYMLADESPELTKTDIEIFKQLLEDKDVRAEIIEAARGSGRKDPLHEEKVVAMLEECAGALEGKDT